MTRYGEDLAGEVCFGLSGSRYSPLNQCFDTRAVVVYACVPAPQHIHQRAHRKLIVHRLPEPQRDGRLSSRRR